MRSTVVDGALYDSARILVVDGSQNERTDGVRRAAKVVDKENASAAQDAPASNTPDPREDGDDFEPLFQPLILTVLSSEESRQASEPENQRKSRVALALTLAERGVRDSAALAAILDTWILTERSRPLREDIQRARLLAQQKP